MLTLTPSTQPVPLNPTTTAERLIASLAPLDQTPATFTPEAQTYLRQIFVLRHLLTRLSVSISQPDGLNNYRPVREGREIERLLEEITRAQAITPPANLWNPRPVVESLSQFTTSELETQLEALRTHLVIRLVEESPGNLTFSLPSLVTEAGIPLPPFTLTFNFHELPCYLDSLTPESTLRFRPTAEDVDSSDLAKHPHIRNTPCFGNFLDPIRSALICGNLTLLASLLEEWYTTYSPDNPFRSIDRIEDDLFPPPPAGTLAFVNPENPNESPPLPPPLQTPPPEEAPTEPRNPEPSPRGALPDAPAITLHPDPEELQEPATTTSVDLLSIAILSTLPPHPSDPDRGIRIYRE